MKKTRLFDSGQTEEAATELAAAIEAEYGESLASVVVHRRPDTGDFWRFVSIEAGAAVTARVQAFAKGYRAAQERAR
jgi:hypothetical protein